MVNNFNKNGVSMKLLFLLLIMMVSFAHAEDNTSDSAYFKAGNWVFISAQPPFIPGTDKVIDNNVDHQIEQVLENFRSQVTTAGGKMKNVVKITVYMHNIDKAFPIVKRYIPLYFEAPYPARTPVGGVSFGSNSNIQITMDGILYMPKNK